MSKNEQLLNNDKRLITDDVIPWVLPSVDHSVRTPRYGLWSPSSCQRSSTGYDCDKRALLSVHGSTRWRRTSGADCDWNMTVGHFSWSWCCFKGSQRQWGALFRVARKLLKTSIDIHVHPLIIRRRLLKASALILSCHDWWFCFLC